MYKTRTRADLLRGLADNQGLANALAEYQTRYGDWRELFHAARRGRQGDQGGYPARGEQGIRRQQPHQRGDRDAAASAPAPRRARPK